MTWIATELVKNHMPTLAARPTVTNAGKTQRAARTVPLTTHEHQNAAKLNRKDTTNENKTPINAGLVNQPPATTYM